MKTTVLQNIAYLLMKTPGIGVIKGHKLLERCDLTSIERFVRSAQGVVNEKDYAELAHALETVDVSSWQDKLSAAGVSVVAFSEEDYPEALENYPDMPEKCHPQSLRVLSPGYLYDGSMKNARYQIQLQLEYYKEV